MPKTKIEFFDCSSEIDMQRSEELLTSQEIKKTELVNFPYLMLVWEE